MTREEYEMVVQHATEFGRATVGVVGAKTQLLAHDDDQRALIEQQEQEIERLKSKVEEWIRRKNHIERAYRGYGTPEEEIAKKAAWMKGQT